ncbi:hypothetical protein WJX72_007175 [[Myrmecia] bisecta]|uniref:Magnesium transporter n=1 Tax=[Myrmecia] bisecta TaxID=41462 RepID=A0AAW1P503_9CHLO
MHTLQHHHHHSTAATRQWLRFDEQGGHSYATADKHKLVAQLGIPYRDLRILDPPVLAQATAAILIREKALVVNMECVRMIICKDQVLLLTVPTAGQGSLQGVAPAWDCAFAKDLRTRLVASSASSRDLMNMQVDKTLPYELHALEAALFSTVRILDMETTDLEAKAGPSLERLTQKVSNRELEMVRNIKSALNKLIDRVNKVKQVLEDILDDDNDMHDMYLARREQISEERSTTRGPTADCEAEATASRQASATRAASVTSRDSERVGSFPRLIEVISGHEGASSQLAKTGSSRYRSRGVFIPLRTANSNLKELEDAREAGQDGEAQLSRRPTMDNAEYAELDLALGEAAQTVAFLKGINLVDPHDIEDCEDLLETYLKQVEGPLSRLNILQERVDATEALVAMSLDHRRNELVAFDLMLTILTVAIAFVSMVASIFGMNLYLIWVNTPLWVFLLACLGSVAVALSFIGSAVYYARLKGLLFIPAPSGGKPMALGVHGHV